MIGCLIFPLLVIIAFFIGFRTFSKSMPSATTIYSDSWLLINPSGLVSDYNEIPYSNFLNLGSASVEDICRNIGLAADDSRIQGIILRPRFAQISYSGISEINQALIAFKKSGKPVYAYGDMLSQKDYLLAISADEVYLEPSASAGIALDGVSAGITFYKEMFDKLGVKMHVLQTGDYKGAGEPYTQTSLRPGTLQNYRRALGARYELILDKIAVQRDLSPAAVKAIFEYRDDFFISPTYALEAGLVDSLLNRDEFFSQYGISTRQLVAVNDYHSSKYARSKAEKIAVVYLSGSIAPGKSNSYGLDTSINAAKLERMLETISKDKSIKSVVVRINSGGGSALESELIYQKLMKLRETLPVVISMGGAAASGGYYISCASDYIVADEYTITGSIGVVMLIPEAEGLSRKIGLRNQNIGFGKFSGSYDFFNKTDPAFLQSLARNSDSVYREFKSRILSTRKITAEDLEAIAQGKIWSASDALSYGLIDEIGGLQTALNKAQELGGIGDYQVLNLPAKLNWMELVRGSSPGKLYSSIKSLKNMQDPSQIESFLKNQFQTREWLFLMPIETD